MPIHFRMKMTSPHLTKAAMILAALLLPATAWWVSWHRQESAKQAEQARAASEKLQAQAAEQQEIQKWLTESKQKRELFQKKYMEGGTIEAGSEVRVLSTWNRPTDPDHVWHEQQQRANRTLIQHGLPTLDGQRSFPDSPALPQAPRVGGQK